YLPLDPAYPQDRLAFMLTDAGAAVLVTQEALVDRLPAQQADVIRLDADWHAIARQPATAPATGPHPQNAAYVIYTSGSTGRPKGVAGTHGGMINRIAAHVDIGPFTEEAVCCQKTSIGFVVSLFEMLGALANGRLLVVIPGGARADFQSIAASVVSDGITDLITVPSVAEALLALSNL